MRVAEVSVQVIPPSVGSTSLSVTLFAGEPAVFVSVIEKTAGEPAAMVPPESPATSGFLSSVSVGGGR